MPKKRHRKRSPASMPATVQDVNRAKERAVAEAVTQCWSIFFRVLIDKHGATIPELQQLWREVEDYSEDVAAGRLKVADIRDSLKQEDGVIIA